MIMWFLRLMSNPLHKILFLCDFSSERHFGRSRLTGHSQHITLFDDGSGQGMKHHNDCRLTNYSALGIVLMYNNQYMIHVTLTIIFSVLIALKLFFVICFKGHFCFIICNFLFSLATNSWVWIVYQAVVVSIFQMTVILMK